MSKEKADKVYWNSLPGFDGYKGLNGSTSSEMFLPASLELREGEPELAFQMLEEALIEEEVEIPIDLYKEIKRISDETDRSVEKTVRGALALYIEKYNKVRRLD